MKFDVEYRNVRNCHWWQSHITPDHLKHQRICKWARDNDIRIKIEWFDFIGSKMYWSLVEFEDFLNGSKLLFTKSVGYRIDNKKEALLFKLTWM